MEKVTEYCPHCECEVEIDAELKVQVCPNCGRHIVTCSMCDACEVNNGSNYCRKCCLDFLATKLNNEKAEVKREEISELLDKYECIPFEDEKMPYTGSNGFGYVDGIVKENGVFKIGYEVNGYLFTDETPWLDNELTLDVAKYIEDNKDTMNLVEKTEKEYQVILYLSGDIVENVTATSVDDAREKVFAKLRAMSDEEFLKHITDARNVGRYAIYDNEKGSLEDEGFDTTM